MRALRFTPARAGTAPWAGKVWLNPPVHPRARGDGASAVNRVVKGHGSPPRARGRRHPTHGEPEGARFTPARAGTA